MKNFLFVLAVLCTTGSFAQSNTTFNQRIKEKPAVNNNGSVFLGVGSGINAATGFFGARVDVKIAERFTLGAGIGSGTWGTKVSLTATYVPASRWCPVVSIGRADGIKDLHLSTNNNSAIANVTINGNAVNYISLGVERQWYTRRGNILRLDLGYAVRASSGALFTQVNDPLNPPTAEQQRAVKASMNAIAPSGIVLSFCYSFRLL
ncbi:MAG: hypothetical protein V4616_13060 [Bacteroidota bacterium]